MRVVCIAGRAGERAPRRIGQDGAVEIVNAWGRPLDPSSGKAARGRGRISESEKDGVGLAEGKPWGGPDRDEVRWRWQGGMLG